MTRRSVLACVTPTVVLPLAAIAAGAVLHDMSIPYLTRDVAGLAELNPIAGFLSSLSILTWWTGASVWLFTALTLSLRGHPGGVALQLHAGLLTAFLGLDDLFQFHEEIGPDMLRIPQVLILVLIVVAGMAFVARHHVALRRSHAWIIAVAFVFLGSSMATDTVMEHGLRGALGDWEYFIEDGLKWAGICFWTAFCVVRCVEDLVAGAPGAAEESG